MVVFRLAVQRTVTFAPRFAVFGVALVFAHFVILVLVSHFLLPHVCLLPFHLPLL